MRAATLARLLRDEVTVTTPSDIDKYGQPTSPISTIVRARVRHSHKRSRTPSGEEFTSTIQVATLHSVAVGDTLTVDGVERSVKATQGGTGTRGGAAFTEAML